jgi:hypothetical protein
LPEKNTFFGLFKHTISDDFLCQSYKTFLSLLMVVVVVVGGGR